MRGRDLQRKLEDREKRETEGKGVREVEELKVNVKKGQSVYISHLLGL